jgi:hypothetical protein
VGSAEDCNEVSIRGEDGNEGTILGGGGSRGEEGEGGDGGDGGCDMVLSRIGTGSGKEGEEDDGIPGEED